MNPTIVDTALWDTLEAILEFIFTAAWKWPAPIRRIYVLMWPVAFTFRILVAVITLITMVALYAAGTVWDYGRAVWRGKETNFMSR